MANQPNLKMLSHKNHVVSYDILWRQNVHNNYYKQ